MQWTEIPRDEMVIPGEPRNMGATPYFRWESIFNEPQSMLQGKPVHILKEVVEIRFAANPQYKPVFGTDEAFEMNEIGQCKISWAERYKAQYQAFLAGSEQEAEGTPLEELIPYGISPAQLSMCRALNIYSVEALAHLPPAGHKRLGMNGNEMIPMAKKYLEARKSGATQQSEINELKRRLAELTDQKGMGEEIKLSTELPAIVPELPEGYENMTDAEMKDALEAMTGARPRGNPSRSTLVALYEQAKAA